MLRVRQVTRSPISFWYWFLKANVASTLSTLYVLTPFFTEAYVPAGIMVLVYSLNWSSDGWFIGTSLKPVPFSSMPMGLPATMNSASACPRSTASKPSFWLALNACHWMPVSFLMTCTVTQVPEPSGPSTTRLPCRSASELMGEPSLATRCISTEKNGKIIMMRDIIFGSRPSWYLSTSAWTMPYWEFLSPYTLNRLSSELSETTLLKGDSGVLQ